MERMAGQDRVGLAMLQARVSELESDNEQLKQNVRDMYASLQEAERTIEQFQATLREKETEG